MKFVDAKHKKFFYKKFEESIKLGKADVYYKSIIYILGICEETRRNFEKIFNIKSGEINIDSIQSGFQTGTSSKVTRMAFSLWNGCNFDSERDIENEKISLKYNVNEIFSCGYAPYFYEGIKIRFPEYTRETNLERIGR